MAQLHYPFGQPPTDVEVFWRVEAPRYSVVIDPDRDLYGVTDPQLEARWWRVKHRTPKGVRLMTGEFINPAWRKKRANPTLDGAIKDFVARKKRQIAILTGRLTLAEAELALVDGNHPIGTTS